MSIKESISVNEVLEVLNSAIEDDRDAIQRLIDSRVECNEKLAHHPTIQVGNYFEKGKFHVGFLGILNGLFGISETGFGVISAIYSVKCPNGHEKELEGYIAGDKCPVCGKIIVLGDLLKFDRTSDKYLYDYKPK